MFIAVIVITTIYYINLHYIIIVAIFYPFSQFCEIDVSLPSL